MSIQTTISTIKTNLISGFAAMDTWLDGGDSLKNSNGIWTRLMVIEHVMLTNHFLLILIEKGTEKAIDRSRNTDLGSIAQHYDLDTRLMEEIASPGVFKWEAPQHMRPSGNVAPEQLRAQLRDQLYRCLVVLDRLENGEGVNYKLTMSVNNLGKLDMYQYMFFLSLHIHRHLYQLQSDAFLTQQALEFTREA
jgi:hypothetical protein